MAAAGPRHGARHTSPVLVAAALALAGCSGADDGPVAPAVTDQPTTVTSDPPTTITTTTTAQPTTSPAPGPTPTPTPSAEPTTPTSSQQPPAGEADEVVAAWRGRDVEAFDTSRDVVALTFDGGASDAAVTSILDTLASEGVPATFFVTGEFARTYPDAVGAMAAGGHPVGNHSDTHPSFPDSTNEQIRAELAAADASIAAVTGEPTAPLFRFPFGARTPLDIEVVNDAGYVPVRWTVDTLGWQGTSEGVTTAVVRQRILDTLRPGQVVLMHVGAHPSDGSTLDADALPGVIDDLAARGYAFVTLPELLAEGP